MGQEINLLKNYPTTKRDTSSRANEKTEKDRIIARKFGKEFFDGDRKHGYGGFKYMSRFWEPVVPTFKKHWNLNSSSSLLDVGCAKGFMLYDFKRLIPGISLTGIDISEYAIENTLTEVRDNVKVADAKLLPFEDKSFDAVISINTIHNLEIDECAQALGEIERVSRGKSFITVDAFRDSDEEKRMFDWNLTAKTILSVEDWLKLFKDVGYTGDYYWFIP
jgi:SAM-dependent methyltransferase|tara:strand:+ start:93 stop:752 length:660 start_codon:yes stop_codon:yes gene_type:complete